MRSVLQTFDGQLRRPAAARYDLVALRVEFQPDTSRFTTGDGTFDGSLYDGLEPSIDPLPHDQAYFDAHLDFLTDYVARVSDGITEVETHLIPEIVRLSGPMSAYAPTGPDADSDAELRKLADMIDEAWALASQQSSFDMTGFDPSRTAFVLFHAGVGRDVELIGTTLDKTPEDLPSLFFDQPSLARLIGKQTLTFNEFPVDHTLVLPRTETRGAMDFISDEPFLFELSINGLLAASFLNYLGVPDLFDTDTGESAIGPFGVMDTQGIFAYRGLFPPEPMAWTKYFLGWTDPKDLGDAGEETISLLAASLPGVSESARAIISDVEYFMVENRHRDPESDGLTLRVWNDGEIVEQHVENGDPDFNSVTVDDFVGGVVVSVDNYDWALPGGLDEDDNELNGGILVWHIDERRLRAGMPENVVNVGVESRAVDLEEADGAQDIGFPSEGPFGPQAELGSPFDFFYEGNPVRVQVTGGREVQLYENRFGPRTFPGSQTNSGGSSFIVLEGFSPPAAEMAFTYRQVTEGGIEPLSNLPIGVPDGSFGPGSFVGCAVACPDVLYSSGADSVALYSAGSVRFASTAPPAIGEDLVTLDRFEDSHRFVLWSSSDGRSSPSETIDLPDDLGSMRAASPIVVTNVERATTYNVLLRGDERTAVVRAALSGVSVTTESAAREAVSLASAMTDLGSVAVVVGRAGVSGIENDWNYSLPTDVRVGQAVFGRDQDGLMGALPITSTGEILLFGSSGSVTTVDVGAAASRFGVEPNDSLAAFPVLADLDGDHRLDVLASFGSMLLAFTQSGALVSDFPIHVEGRIAGQPLVAEFGGSTGIVAASTNGYIYAVDVARDQHAIDGFPLEVGNAAPATPALSADGTLVAVAENGNVKGWTIPNITSVPWGRMYGSGENDSFVAISDPGSDPNETQEPLIVTSETYNWPNPIGDGSTNLRIATRRDARVSIRIIDAAGLLVDDIDMGDVRAGLPTEAVWQADAESGLYFARFTARTADGEEETKLVKMAVMR